MRRSSRKGCSWRIRVLLGNLRSSHRPSRLLRADGVWEVRDSTSWEATLLEGEAGLGIFTVRVNEGVDFKK